MTVYKTLCYFHSGIRTRSGQTRSIPRTLSNIRIFQRVARVISSGSESSSDSESGREIEDDAALSSSAEEEEELVDSIASIPLPAVSSTAPSRSHLYLNETHILVPSLFLYIKFHVNIIIKGVFLYTMRQLCYSCCHY